MICVSAFKRDKHILNILRPCQKGPYQVINCCLSLMHGASLISAAVTEYAELVFGGKTENRCEKMESNSNVSAFPSILEHDKIYCVFFDVMPPLLACYTLFCDVYRTDLICRLCDMISDYRSVYHAGGRCPVPPDTCI